MKPKTMINNDWGRWRRRNLCQGWYTNANITDIYRYYNQTISQV